MHWQIIYHKCHRLHGENFTFDIWMDALYLECVRYKTCISSTNSSMYSLWDMEHRTKCAHFCFYSIIACFSIAANLQKDQAQGYNQTELSFSLMIFK